MSNNNFAGISFGYDSKKIFEEREDTMCGRWKKTSNVNYENCSLNVLNDSNKKFFIKGSSPIGYTHVKYWAAAAPTYSTSYSGSGLPYPNEYEAYENSSNVGIIELKGGQFEIKLDYPNSYYDNMGKDYIEPRVNFQFCDSNGNSKSKVNILTLGEGIPFRSLTFSRKRDWNNGPMWFCNNNLPVRTQEQILRDSAYPLVNKEPINFWGLMPPH